jgi:hypothetical protein
MKKLSDSCFYDKLDYDKPLFSYLMGAQRVDKDSDSFTDIVYDVKRQASSVLVKVLLSKRVVLMIDQKGISRSFKVIYSLDPKNRADKHKVFIDCTGIITYENGEYKVKKISVLISYLITAMTYVTYYNLPKAITSNSVLMKSSTEAFVDLMLYVLEYLKVPVTYNDNKERMSFALAEYYQICIVGRENGESVYNLAKSISGIKEKKTCDYLNVIFANFLTEELTFDKFLAKFAEVFLGQSDDNTQISPKNRARLTADAFVQRWMYAYGPSTFLALDCFVPFSQLLTDTYVGAYLNQQNTIEKVVGKNFTIFTNELLKVGSENA